MNEYEIDSEESCPKCGHSPVHYRYCTSLFCEDGYCDEYEDDPINFMPGESFTLCPECHGMGIEKWCPECGYDISEHNAIKQFNQLSHE